MARRHRGGGEDGAPGNGLSPVATRRPAGGGAVSSVEALREFAPEVGVVLGSGLGAVAEAISVEGQMAFGDMPELPVARVAGHAGRFVWGQLGGRRVVLQQGRVHLYEGHSAGEVTS